MILRDTDIDSAVAARARQRALIEGRSPRVSEFLMNPYRFGGGGGGPSDPDYSNVSCLLHMNGSNGSTSIVDNGPGALTFTAAGTAALSTTQAKFGTASFNPGNGNARTSSMTGFQFGSGAFTIEAWVYLTGTPTSAVGIATNWKSGDLSWYFGIDNSRKVVLYWSTNGSSGTFPASTAAVALNTWTYVAASRSGTTLSLSAGGSVSTSAISGALFSTLSTSLTIGADGSTGSGTQQLAGYIDEVRITKSVARTISSVPTAEFPNF